MTNASRFHPNFPSDLAAATQYYDDISILLGDRFRDGVRQALNTIVERPESFGLVSGRLRATMIRQFPYVVIYRVIDQTIYFLWVFHAASDPNRWHDREEKTDV